MKAALARMHHPQVQAPPPATSTDWPLHMHTMSAYHHPHQGATSIHSAVQLMNIGNTTRKKGKRRRYDEEDQPLQSLMSSLTKLYIKTNTSGMSSFIDC
ncbi:unnamed protein product [Rotaria socialis]|uniref:Uncharacterized protein n=1 Tax=Rotaria socialis TaxID=392032 RepID=A0A818DGY8_9BILA|nr:unnamed protein product [Rotaria socialis]